VSSPAYAWLERSRAALPPALAAVVEQTITDSVAGSGHTEVLSAAALACLRTAWQMGDERAAAVHLLAADALITAALELAADSEPELAELVARCTADRIFTLFREELSSEHS
jgi:hypothetical protein